MRDHKLRTAATHVAIKQAESNYQACHEATLKDPAKYDHYTNPLGQLWSKIKDLKSLEDVQLLQVRIRL